MTVALHMPGARGETCAKQSAYRAAFLSKIPHRMFLATEYTQLFVWDSLDSRAQSIKKALHSKIVAP